MGIIGDNVQPIKDAESVRIHLLDCVQALGQALNASGDGV